MAGTQVRGYETQNQPIKVQGLFDESVDQIHKYGTHLLLDDGRCFRYGKMGAVAGAAGKLYQAEAAVADHVNKAVQAAVAVDAKSIPVTLGATAAAVNLYAEGFIQINDAAGEGYQYKIREHASVLASGVITAKLYDPVLVALTTSSEASFFKHSYKDVIVHPSPPTAQLIGVPLVALTAAYFGWFQTWGLGIVLADGTPAAGAEVAASDAVDGAVEVYAVATGPKVGIMGPSAAVDTEYKPVVLMLGI